MNKVTFILFSIFTFFLFTSCTREDDLLTAVEENEPADVNGTYSEAHWRRVHAAQRQAYIGDLYRSYGVGYGYNGTGKYSDYDEVRDRVINLSYIQQFDAEHGSSTVVDDVSPSSFHHVYSGTDAMTICQKLTAKASAKVDLPEALGRRNSQATASHRKACRTTLLHQMVDNSVLLTAT